MSGFVPPGLGWHRDLPDLRDYSPETPMVKELLAPLTPADTQPPCVSLREYFPDPYDQNGLHSSPAQACVGLIEYFQRRAFGRTVLPSRMFVYQTARKLMGIQGDTSLGLRTTLKAILRFGLPPERYWHYSRETADREPEAFLYSLRGKLPHFLFFRLDREDRPGQTLQNVRAFLAAGFPVAFGFPVPTSITTASEIPYRPTFDSHWGGQAVVAVGYDDDWLRSSKGALLIRNSWGKQWGDDGYGWLPYAYVEERLAVDFWTILSAEWLNCGEFERPQCSRPVEETEPSRAGGH